MTADCWNQGNKKSHVGDQPVVFVDVLNDEGLPFTPAGGRLLIAKPGATVSTVVPWAALVKEPGGVVGRVEYSFPLPLDVSGLWRVWWEFTAGVVAAEPYQFAVSPRTVPAPP